MPDNKISNAKSSLISRLNRIEGQIRGIRNMIEDDKYCVDVFIQVAAAKSALNSVSALLMESHIKRCVKKAIDSGHGEEVLDELTEVMKKYFK
ncbi:MAG: Repressor CsoR of the copZA operon [Firmicutes bacterium]|nr:Repressor CsoR of the copZA operon [Bacillota bacterium]